ncbi:MAG: hypothetical protein R3C32_00310 [Chloroflexota bacterium]
MAGLPLAATGWRHPHLLDVDALTKDELRTVLDLAASMSEARGTGGTRGADAMRPWRAGRWRPCSPRHRPAPG